MSLSSDPCYPPFHPVPLGVGVTERLSPPDFPFHGKEWRGKSCHGCDLFPPPLLPEGKSP